MSKPVQIGLVGLGRAGNGMHRKELESRRDKFNFAAVCDIIEERTKPFVEEWGSRKLAYPINDKEDGYYVLMNFTSGNAFPRELDRLLRINDGIMRSLIVCKGE